jgi:hypothetical protein
LLLQLLLVLVFFEEKAASGVSEQQQVHFHPEFSQQLLKNVLGYPLSLGVYRNWPRCWSTGLLLIR